MSKIYTEKTILELVFVVQSKIISPLLLHTYFAPLVLSWLIENVLIYCVPILQNGFKFVLILIPLFKHFLGQQNVFYCIQVWEVLHHIKYCPNIPFNILFTVFAVCSVL